MGENRRTPYFGHFVLFGEIARGGMGIVYRAQQTKLDRTVALKVLHSGTASGQAGIQRFHIEAEAAAKLDHPNIVPIFEFGEHDGHPYLAMQLVEGESLAEYMARAGPDIKEREAASLIQKIAGAVQHAHERGVLHRDLKPGNILLDATGEPHLIDFGLAKWIAQDSGMTQTGAFLGTPAYAPPEQLSGNGKAITTASDIYSLGAILYVLLTGQAPVAGDSISEIIHNSRNSPPRRPRALRPDISKDLEVICVKCLEKEPARRYVSAGELAQDLERFLEGAPILARSVGVVEQLWMWARRHPVHAGLWVTAGLLVLALPVGVFIVNQVLGRELSLQRSRTIRLTTRTSGWSEQARSNLESAVHFHFRTAAARADLRNEAAALLAGLDVFRIAAPTNFEASSVQFDASGRRVVIGRDGDGARLWEESRGITRTNSRTGLGPVALMAGDVPVQLSFEANAHSLLLTGILDDEVRREWKVPIRIKDKDVPLGRPRLVALSHDGSIVAAVLALSDEQEAVVASKGDSFEVLGVSNAPVTALGISANGELVGVAASDRTVTIWAPETGERLASVPLGHNTVLCLAFARSKGIPETGTNVLSRSWTMGAGDAGGTVTLWDICSGSEKAHFRCGHYGVTALAFSPDGVTLASGGMGPVKLWDRRSERLLLNIWTCGSGEKLTGLDFSRDGLRLALSNRGGNANASHVEIWRLEFDRGIQTLRGLSGQISKICLSPDGTRLAAMSHGWEVGVWNLADGHLLRTFEVPEGVSADNVALAFSPNGDRLAFSAGKTAKLWEISSGIELKSWGFLRGLNDTLSFPDAQHLLLVRKEGGTNPVVLFRDLLNYGESPIATNTQFNLEVYAVTASSTGHVFVVEGAFTNSTGHYRCIKGFDGFSGEKLWKIDSKRAGQSSTLTVDAGGRFAGLLTNAPGAHAEDRLLVQLSTGLPALELPHGPTAICLELGLYAVCNERQFDLFTTRNGPALISLGVDSDVVNAAQFSACGDLFAWGNVDGTVMVCNLGKVRQRLSSVGLQLR